MVNLGIRQITQVVLNYFSINKKIWKHAGGFASPDDPTAVHLFSNSHEVQFVIYLTMPYMYMSMYMHLRVISDFCFNSALWTWVPSRLLEFKSRIVLWPYPAGDPFCCASQAPLPSILCSMRMHNRDSHDARYVTQVYNDCQSDEEMGRNTGGKGRRCPPKVHFVSLSMPPGCTTEPDEKNFRKTKEVQQINSRWTAQAE